MSSRLSIPAEALGAMVDAAWRDGTVIEEVGATRFGRSGRQVQAQRTDPPRSEVLLFRAHLTAAREIACCMFGLTVTADGDTARAVGNLWVTLVDDERCQLVLVYS